MKIEIQSINYFVKDNLKDLINKKVQKLSKYFNDTASAKILCKLEKDDLYKMELVIIDKGVIFKSECTTGNMYDNLDIVLPKVEKQIVKTFNKVRDKLRQSVKIDALEFVKEIIDEKQIKPLKVVKNKKVQLVPLTQEDAILNMEMLGHSFYIYLSKETGNVHLLYTRNDGDLGEIEAEL